MKHFRVISNRAPRTAALWQEIVCQVAVGLNIFLEFLGGSSPILLFVEDKCDLPQPNDGTDDTTT